MANWRNAPQIADFWFDLFAEHVSVERLRRFWGDDYVQRAPVMAAAYASAWSMLERLATEELLLRNEGGNWSRAELLEACADLQIVGRSRMTKAQLLGSLVENRRSTRDFYMAQLLDAEAADRYNKAVFGSKS